MSMYVVVSEVLTVWLKLFILKQLLITLTSSVQVYILFDHFGDIFAINACYFQTLCVNQFLLFIT